MKKKHTRSLRFRDGGDERHKTGAAEELSDKDSSVALGFRGVNPLQARAENTGLTAALSENAATVAAHVWEEDGAMEMVVRMEMRGEEGMGEGAIGGRRREGGIYKSRKQRN